MLSYIFKRLIQAVPLVILISMICFLFMQLAPYDAVDAIITPDMSKAEVESRKEAYGLNDSIPVQYMNWLRNLLRGDFGYSLRNRTSIRYDLAKRIPNTLKLALPAYTIAYLLATLLGLIAGSRRNHWADKLIDGFCSIGLATPSFWLAMLIMYQFSYKWKCFPLMGMHTIGKEGDFVDFLLHLAMPLTTLVIALLPDLIRYVRSATIGEMKEDYVLVQKAFGAKNHEILLHHVSRNVLLPLVTKMGMSLPAMVTGAVITETIFNWPGIGSYFVNAIQAMDYPIVMSILVLSGSLVIIGNLLADVLYGLLDPRISVLR